MCRDKNDVAEAMMGHTAADITDNQGKCLLADGQAAGKIHMVV